MDALRLVYRCRACTNTFTKPVRLNLDQSEGDFLVMVARAQHALAFHKCGYAGAGSVRVGLGDLIGLRDHVE